MFANTYTGRKPSIAAVAAVPLAHLPFAKPTSHASAPGTLPAGAWPAVATATATAPPTAVIPHVDQDGVDGVAELVRGFREIELTCWHQCCRVFTRVQCQILVPKMPNLKFYLLSPENSSAQQYIQ